MLLVTLALGCALSAHRTGLVKADGEQVLLVEPTGRSFRVPEAGEGSVIGALEQCVVDVRGPRLGRIQWVRQWSVLDAGDGSPPYVGVLRRYGGHWMLDDRNSGQPVILDPKTVGALSAEEGRLVLIRGMVVGAQTVAVVAWRALEPAPLEPKEPSR